MTDPAGVITDFVYDKAGRPTSAFEHELDLAVDYETRTTYDTWDRPIQVQNIYDSTAADTTYNAEGYVTRSADELNIGANLYYDDNHRLLYSYDGISSSDHNVYNDNGWLYQEVDVAPYPVVVRKEYDYTDRGELYSLQLRGMSNPEYWTYNPNGKVSNYYWSDGVNQKDFYYDDLDRLSTIGFPNDPDNTFTYDDNGRMLTMTDASGTTDFTYFDDGKLHEYKPPSNVDVTYTYNDSGQVINVNQAGVGDYVYTYETGPDTNRLWKIENPVNEVTEFTYNSVGQLKQKEFDAGHKEVYTYDSRGRVTSILLKDVGGSAYREQTYAYDAASKIQTYKLINSVTPTDLQHIDYDYYSDSSLKSEDHIGTTNDVSYSYYAPGNANGHGNLRYRKQGPLLSPTTVDEYFYANHDELDHITRGGGSYKSYSYDDNGRTTDVTTAGPNTTSFTYDDSDRVSGITYHDATVDSFDYNAMDTRLSKTENTVGTDYNRSGPGVTAPVLSVTGAVYTPGISESHSSATTYQHSGIKNTAYQTDSGGSVSAIKEYDAFGNDLATSGTWQGPFGYGGGFGYQSTDRSGLMLLGHRYYDPSIGRFITPDPIKSGSNWYEYGGRNPVIGADPTGLLNLGPLGGSASSLINDDRYKLIYLESHNGDDGKEEWFPHPLGFLETSGIVQDADYLYVFNEMTGESLLLKLKTFTLVTVLLANDKLWIHAMAKYSLIPASVFPYVIEPGDSNPPGKKTFEEIVAKFIPRYLWPDFMLPQRAPQYEPSIMTAIDQYVARPNL